MINKYSRVIILIIFVFSINTTFAGGPPPPPPPLPIDGGFLGLFALAIGYAVKKINDISKK
ncbi:MAG: hypothetical protein KAH67_04100 [Flavobacteriaceae bacterium]|nr:hypothetical protein [Flavobacteriaceae bacterium]